MKKILLVGLLVLCAVAIAIPLQAAFADAPDGNTVSFFGVTLWSGDQPDGTEPPVPANAQEVPCPTGNGEFNIVVNTDNPTAAEPVQMKCFEFKDGQLPQIQGTVSIDSADIVNGQFEGSECAQGETSITFSTTAIDANGGEDAPQKGRVIVTCGTAETPK